MERVLLGLRLARTEAYRDTYMAYIGVYRYMPWQDRNGERAAVSAVIWGGIPARFFLVSVVRDSDGRSVRASDAGQESRLRYRIGSSEYRDGIFGRRDTRTESDDTLLST